MAFKKKKKPPVLSKEDQEEIRERLNASKRFFKPLRGEIIYKRDGSSQDVVATARYYTEEDIEADAKRIVDSLNSINNGKHWSVISWRVLGNEMPTNENQEENNEEIH